MRRNLTVAATLTLLGLGVACSKGPTIPLPSFAPISTVAAATPIEAPGTLAPSPSLSSAPGVSGSVRRGIAALTLSGDASGTVEFAKLATPAVWSTPPGAMALVWTGKNGQSFELGGASFSGQEASSPTHTVSFTVRLNGRLVVFTATAGQCIVTINQAETSAMAGVLQCAGVPSVGGSFTANAQGTFTATG